MTPSACDTEMLRIFRISVSELDEQGFEQVIGQLDDEIILRLAPGGFRWLFRSLSTADLLMMRQFLETEKIGRAHV